MSPEAGLVAASAASSEKDANRARTVRAKLRSCVVCRNRKVRCDKQSPCSNCRRANIACVFPATDRPPRWTRHLERYNNYGVTSDSLQPQTGEMGLAAVTDRLQHLEDLVQQLRGQLEQAQAAASSTAGSSSGINSPASATQHLSHDIEQRSSLSANDTGVRSQFGRLVIQDVSSSHYVSSPFWSRVDDEVRDTGSLTEDGSDSSDEAPLENQSSNEEFERTPSERHAFLFGHNLRSSAPDSREFSPLPSQIPFLVEVFSENVNFFIRVVHTPTVTKMVRDLRSGALTRLTPSNEALMFSIYYVAMASMEEEDAMTNFGASKNDLKLRYRLGLEHALAKADFLNAPDIVLVQAFTLFLVLARRHDNPRFVWMMTGLVVRMAYYLGLQRDGSHFEHLTPFEIESRRRLWWAICWLDVRAAEDQGTDLAVTTFDTKIPLNINDVDISPEAGQMPMERHGVADNTFARITAKIIIIHRQLMAAGTTQDVGDLNSKSRLLDNVYQEFEQGYLQYSTESGNIAYWVSVTVARLVMAKLTLWVFLPVLFTSPNEDLSSEIRTKLLVAAIEVAEYNQALNAEHACRQWRWIYQTRTHWHSIVYLLLEVSRRPWSPMIERAWLALHSNWLIPPRTATDRRGIWVPFRKLMAKARKHREAEIQRLRADPQAVARLEMEYQETPLPSSSGPFSKESSAEIFRERWCKLVALPKEPRGETLRPEVSGSASPADSSMHANHDAALVVHISSEPIDPNAAGQQTDPALEGTDFEFLEPFITEHSFAHPSSGQDAGPAHDPTTTFGVNWSSDRIMEPNHVNWLWADTDFSMNLLPDPDVDTGMDLEGEVDWYDWVRSAKRAD